MIFKKRLNNNVVIAIDGTDEKILTGKGLGFQMQAGWPDQGHNRGHRNPHNPNNNNHKQTLKNRPQYRG